MSEKGLVVHISLTADEKIKYKAAVESSDFNHDVFSKKALMASVNTQNRKSKMHQPNDIRDGMKESK